MQLKRSLDESARRVSEPGASSTEASMLGLHFGNGEDPSSPSPFPQLDDKRESWNVHLPASDISRTPSQSTTGTSKSHNSLETAASSTQSGPSSSTDSKHNDDDHRQPSETKEKPLPSIPSPESPFQYTTACSTPEEMSRQKRETDELRRFHALHELVETERSYAEDLHILEHVFVSNLTNQAFFEESEERVRAIRRNISQLTTLHSGIAKTWDSIMNEQNVCLHSDKTVGEKAASSSEAIRQIATSLTQSVGLFREYRFFCSRHAEALVVIREAERRHNGEDFAAFERTCGNLIRSQARSSTSARATPLHSATPSTANVAYVSQPPLSPVATASDEGTSRFSSAPSSGTTTPAGSLASLPSRTSSKLIFADYLIKPIQRLCLYPLVLNSLLKYTPPHEMLTYSALQGAIETMRTVADEVDEASRIREKDLMAELTLSRIEPTSDLPLSLLKSLGPPQLSGTLDVLHHHSVETPLTAPLRFQHLGAILWSNFILFVRTRKNRQLECRHWFPLCDVSITPKEAANTTKDTTAADRNDTTLATLELAGRPLLPFAFRLTYRKTHHFELSASHEREFITWHNAIRMTCESVKEISQSPSLVSSPKVSNLSASETGSPYGGALISDYLAANLKQPLVSSLDNLIKLPSVSTRNAIDRSMIFSDLLVAPVGIAGLPATMVGGSSALKEISEALVAQQLRQSGTPSIGSAVGAAMGLAKMAASQKLPTVKRVRKMSSLTPIDVSNLKLSFGQMSPIIAKDSKQSPSMVNGDPSTTPKRMSLNSLRANSAVSAKSNSTIVADSPAGTSAASRRLSSPNMTTTIGSRVKGSLLRANSRKVYGDSGSTPGSLTTSPNGSVLDLPPTHTTTSSSSSSRDSEGDTVRPMHARTKSSALRDVWATTISSRRARSQSANSAFTMGPPYEGIVIGRVQSPLEYTTSPHGSQHSAKPSPTASPLDSPVLQRDEPLAFTSFGSASVSAPSSAQNSRRQSMASIFSFGNVDEEPSSTEQGQKRQQKTDHHRTQTINVVMPLKQSSPALSMAQVREGAAVRLKNAKSAVRNRMSMYSNGIDMSPHVGSTAQPLASATTAQGQMSVAQQQVNASPSGAEEIASLSDDLGRLPSVEEGQREADVRRSVTIADRLRGSLSRKSSTRLQMLMQSAASRSETNVVKGNGNLQHKPVNNPEKSSEQQGDVKADETITEETFSADVDAPEKQQSVQPKDANPDTLQDTNDKPHVVD